MDELKSKIQQIKDYQCFSCGLILEAIYANIDKLTIASENGWTGLGVNEIAYLVSRNNPDIKVNTTLSRKTVIHHIKDHLYKWGYLYDADIITPLRNIVQIVRVYLNGKPMATDKIINDEAFQEAVKQIRGKYAYRINEEKILEAKTSTS